MNTWSCFTYGHWNGIKHTHCFFPSVSHNLHFRTERGAEAVGSEIIERSIHMNFSLSQKRHHMLITTTTEQHAVDWKDLWSFDLENKLNCTCFALSPSWRWRPLQTGIAHGLRHLPLQLWASRAGQGQTLPYLICSFGGHSNNITIECRKLTCRTWNKRLDYQCKCSFVFMN